MCRYIIDKKGAFICEFFFWAHPQPRVFRLCFVIARFAAFPESTVADICAHEQTLIENAEGKIAIQIIKPFEPIQIGGYTLTALNAWHGTTEPFIYLISDGEKTVLYANDTDSLPEASMDYLRKTRPIIDLVAADCTAGNSPEIMYRAHMGMIQNRELRGALIGLGCITADTPYYLNHFSHNGYDVLYDEFCEIVEKEGFKVAFDGLEIEL